MATKKRNTERVNAQGADVSDSFKRIAVIGGLRTPFVKSFGVFEFETTLSLSVRVATELVGRFGINAHDIDEVIWGCVVPQTKNANLAREIVLFAGLPNSIPGYTINRACASSLQSVQLAADAIRLNRASLVMAGGVEVLSDVPITFSDEARLFLTKLSKSKSLGEKIGLIKNLKPKIFMPQTPSVSEPFTGLTMGESAELMAQKNNISRERQDEWAYESHIRAAKSIATGFHSQTIIPVWSGKEKNTFVDADNIVRADTTLASLATLKPAFSKPHGTITAGSASALTDGAAGLLIASEDYAKEHHLPIQGYIVDSITVGVDPKDQLLIGPALAIPKLLRKHNLSLDDVGVYEIHEAFAAQVLSCIDKMNDPEFCKTHLGLDGAFGKLPAEKINILGSSIAYGHPFAATGARMIEHALRLAKQQQSSYAVVAVCAAGGMGQAMLLKTE